MLKAKLWLGISKSWKSSKWQWMELLQMIEYIQEIGHWVFACLEYRSQKDWPWRTWSLPWGWPCSHYGHCLDKARHYWCWNPPPSGTSGWGASWFHDLALASSLRSARHGCCRWSARCGWSSCCVDCGVPDLANLDSDGWPDRQDCHWVTPPWSHPHTEDDLWCQDNWTSATVSALQTLVQIVESKNDFQYLKIEIVFDEMEILVDSNLPNSVSIVSLC